MSAIDGPSEPAVAEKDPDKRDAAVKLARAEICSDKTAQSSGVSPDGLPTTRNCLRWLKLEPLDAKLKELTLGIGKAKRPLQDAEERFKNAEAKAHPQFDLKYPMAYLVGTYEIRQAVTTW